MTPQAAWELRCSICNWSSPQRFATSSEASEASARLRRGCQSCPGGGMVFAREYKEETPRPAEPTITLTCIQCQRTTTEVLYTVGITRNAPSPFAHTSALCPTCAAHQDHTQADEGWLLAWEGQRPQGAPISEAEMLQALAAIRAASDDAGDAHCLEDTLYRRFLQWMARDAPDPWRGLAVQLLTTQEQTFPRYYS